MAASTPIVSRITVTNSKTKVGESTDLVSITSRQIFNTFQVRADPTHLFPGTTVSIGLRESGVETILASGIDISAFTVDRPAYVWKAGAFASTVSALATFFIRLDGPIFSGNKKLKLRADTVTFVLFTFNS